MQNGWRQCASRTRHVADAATRFARCVPEAGWRPAAADAVQQLRIFASSDLRRNTDGTWQRDSEQCPRLFLDTHRIHMPFTWRELASEDHPLLVGCDVDVRLDAAAAGDVVVPRHVRPAFRA